MKILISFIALLQITSANASLVGIMDSGTDMSHKDLISKTWRNLKELPGSVDLDGDGLPGDVIGYDFTSNSAKPFNPQYNYFLTLDVKKFFLYYSHYETKKVTPDELTWLKNKSKDQEFMSIVNFVGGYIHGTHVAGISTIANDNAKILPLKIIPTVYHKPSPDSTKSLIGNSSLITTVVTSGTMAEFAKELTDLAHSKIEQMIQMHKILNFHKVDVVNQSFGIGWKDSAGFIVPIFNEVMHRDPTADELEKLQNVFFNTLINEGPRMFAAAPNTVFCIAAGNDASDNDAHPDYPSSIKAENRIVVAATNGYKELADFSNFGAKRVDVAAPGVAITSTAPTNSYIPLSGTSQATPFVTNTIAQMKDVNPNLTVRQITAIIFGTVDVKSWLKGKVVTSGIVNKERAIKAALLLKTESLDKAISDAKAQVSDVPVLKSFDSKPIDIGFKFNIQRPSLLIVQ